MKTIAFSIADEVPATLKIDQGQLARVCLSLECTPAEFAAIWIKHGLVHCDRKSSVYDASVADTMRSNLESAHKGRSDLEPMTTFTWGQGGAS